MKKIFFALAMLSLGYSSNCTLLAGKNNFLIMRQFSSHISRPLREIVDIDYFIIECHLLKHKQLAHGYPRQVEFTRHFKQLLNEASLEHNLSEKQAKKLNKALSDCVAYLQFEKRVAQDQRRWPVFTGNEAIRKLLEEASILSLEPLITEFLLMYIHRMRGISYQEHFRQHHVELKDDFFSGENSFFHLLSYENQYSIIRALVPHESLNFVREKILISQLNRESKEQLLALLIELYEKKIERKLMLLNGKKE